MEEVKVFLALIGHLGRDMSMLTDVVLHGIADQRLSRELDGCKFADALVYEVLRGVLLVHESLSQALRSLSGPRWHVGHLLHLEVLQELSP